VVSSKVCRGDVADIISQICHESEYHAIVFINDLLR
jgi:hypothetical protein